MKSAKLRKLQYLLIKELLDNGRVELFLPDGITIEVGIIQEDEFGKKKKTDDYCYVVATRENKTAILDSYNLGMQFEPENDSIVYDDESFDKNGKLIRTLEVV